MKYWWYAYKKGGEVIQLTPDEAAEAMENKQAGKPIMIPRLKLMLDAWEITEFEQSQSRMDDPDYLGLGSGVKVERPKESSKGNVLVQWAKRLVTDRVYQRDYANRPGYWALRRAEDEGGVYVVHSRPVHASGLPEDLEDLEGFETAIIERRLADTPGWWNA